MANEVTIYFDSPKLFEANNIKPLIGIAGLYFIPNHKIVENVKRSDKKE
jgi:hypothetical protein